MIEVETHECVKGEGLYYNQKNGETGGSCSRDVVHSSSSSFQFVSNQLDSNRLHEQPYLERPVTSKKHPRCSSYPLGAKTSPSQKSVLI